MAVGLRAGCQSLNGRISSQEGTGSGELEPTEQGEWASTQKHQWQESEPNCNDCFVVMEQIILVCGRCTLSYPDKVFELASKHVRMMCQQIILK